MPVSSAVKLCRMASMLMLFTSLVIVALPAGADNHSKAAEAHIEAMIGSAKTLLTTDSGDLAERTEQVTKLLDTYFDFPSITRFSAGQYWRAASVTEKEEYVLVIREVITGTVVRNFDQLKGLEYSHVASTEKGSKLVLVKGRFSDAMGERPSVLVNWRVTTLPEKPVKVLDIEIENISMLVTQKQENAAIIRKNKGKFGALITAMRKKLASQHHHGGAGSHNAATTQKD